MKSFEYTIKDELGNPRKTGRNAGKGSKNFASGMHHHKRWKNRKN